jgi:hypothetical protein
MLAVLSEYLYRNSPYDYSAQSNGLDHAGDKA